MTAMRTFSPKQVVHRNVRRMISLVQLITLTDAVMLSALLLFAVLVFTVYGQLMMKSRALAHATDFDAQGKLLHYLLQMFMDVGVLSAIGAAFLAGVCWMLAIALLDVGFAYPFMALSFVLVPIGSKLLFGEVLPAMQLLALALIIAGVTLSALSR
jgi:multidrug transporter EmrE-like cation transporter